MVYSHFYYAVDASPPFAVVAVGEPFALPRPTESAEMQPRYSRDAAEMQPRCVRRGFMRT